MAVYAIYARQDRQSQPILVVCIRRILQATWSIYRADKSEGLVGWAERGLGGGDININKEATALHFKLAHGR